MHGSAFKIDTFDGYVSFKFMQNRGILHASRGMSGYSNIFELALNFFAADETTANCELANPGTSSEQSEDPAPTTANPTIGSSQYDVYGVTVTVVDGNHICGACQKSFKVSSKSGSKFSCMRHIWGVHLGNEQET